MESVTPEPGPALSRRERVRAATVGEIKATAMRMLRERGADLRFADIARDMGMTAPALYRYYTDRDELLADLMADGFGDLSAQMSAALDAVGPDDFAARIGAAAGAYRDFATSDPALFSLMFGLPNPGFGSHREHASGPAAGATMAVLEQLVRSMIDHGRLAPPLVRRVGPQWTIEVGTAQSADGARIPAESYQALLHFLAAVHGFVCLESFGHLDWISVGARQELFDAQIGLLVLAMGAGPHVREGGDGERR